MAAGRGWGYSSGVSGERIWSRRIADELWSGIVTPLTFSTLVEPMSEHMVRRRLASAGLAALAAEPVFRLSRGRVYVNASLVAAVMREIPAPFASEGLLELLPAELRASVRAGQRGILSPSLARIVLHLAVYERGWLPWARAAVFRDAASRAATDVEALSIPPGAGTAQIAVAFDELTGRLGRYLDAVSWGMIYAYVFFHLTAELLTRWAPERAGSMPELTMGIDGIHTFAIHDELLASATVARDDTALREAVANDASEVAARCVRGDLGAFGARIRGILARHGHRLAGRDLAYPTWREQPAVVVEMVQKLLAAGARETAVARRARHREALRLTLEQIASGIGGSLRRLVFQRAFAWCEEYYVLRENMRYHADLFLAGLRHLSLAAGGHLAAAGVLARPDDVFYLELGELRDALQGRAPADLVGRAVARREQYELFAAAEPAESIGADEEVAASVPRVLARAQPEPDSAVTALSGLGVSPGRAVGRARVVQSVDDLKALEAGEVIVAAATDPSWTSLLALGGALVLEMGGLLSHGAIVARELGIPAVVDVAQATRLLVTGDRVVVDGQAGTVARA